jgi:putative hydrolase of the HAD superfamily
MREGGQRGLGLNHRAVIFDLYGTLITGASRPEQYAFLRDLAAAMGTPYEPFAGWFSKTHVARQTGGYASNEAWAAHMEASLGLPRDPQRAIAASRLYQDFTASTFGVRQEAVALLRQLKGLGCKTGLISDCGPTVPAIFAACALAPLIDAPVFSCVACLKKPDPRIYHLACERLGVTPGDCLYVGDGGSRELSGAADVGMHPVRLLNPSPDASRSDDWQGPVARTLADVLTLLA